MPNFHKSLCITPSDWCSYFVTNLTSSKEKVNMLLTASPYIKCLSLLFKLCELKLRKMCFDEK